MDQIHWNWWLDSGAGITTPFWLAGGIPESTGYTIYDPLSAADLATSYVNLANPGTRNATVPTAAPTHAQGSGWTFNGTTQYLDSNTLAVNEQTIIIWVENAGGTYAIGGWTNAGGVKGAMINPTNSAFTEFYRGTASTNMNGATVGGILSLSKNSAFKNAVAFGTPAALSANSLTMFIGVHNQTGTPSSYYSGRILRVAIYNITLTTEQIEAVTDAMFAYNQPSVNSYASQVLALNPICYYPCSQAIGSVLFDLSGNKAHGESFNLPVGQSGLYGNSVAGDGNINNSIRTIPGWDVLTGFDLNEFSFACWIKVTTTPSNQVRIFNAYSSALAEYYAFEVRTGNQLSLFTRVNGVDQNSGTLASTVNDTWHHVVCYNSLSTLKYGIYLDGVKYDLVKTTGSFNDTSPDTTYPFSAQDLAGNIQHLAYFDHALTQSEVNGLL